MFQFLRSQCVSWTSKSDQIFYNTHRALDLLSINLRCSPQVIYSKPRISQQRPSPTFHHLTARDSRGQATTIKMMRRWNKVNDDALIFMGRASRRCPVLVKFQVELVLTIFCPGSGPDQGSNRRRRAFYNPIFITTLFVDGAVCSDDLSSFPVAGARWPIVSWFNGAITQPNMVFRYVPRVEGIVSVFGFWTSPARNVRHVYVLLFESPSPRGEWRQIFDCADRQRGQLKLGEIALQGQMDS